MDLRGAGLRFQPEGSGYTVSRVDAPLRPDTGARLPLGGDDTRSVRLPFSFPFFGRSYAEVHVNSDSNPTFDRGALPWRQVFVIVGVGGPPDAAAIEKVERMRAAWEAYFPRSTGGRRAVETRLN